jgi:beta-glucosidase
VESDWIFGTRSTEPSLAAGLDVEMPAPKYNGARQHAALRAGRVQLAQIDEAVRHILRVKLAFGLTLEARGPEGESVIECEAHQELALEAAHASMVLLKNEGGLLPLDPARVRPLAVLGRLAALENTGDRGSSAVSSSFVVSALEGLAERLPAGALRSFPRDVLSEADREGLRACAAAVVVVGLTWREEGERIPLVEGGGDRDTLRLPAEQERLIREVAALVPRTIVVIEAGSAVEVRPFVDAVPGLLLAWYPGMLGGEALADVLFGRVCPSGRLPISMARDARDLVDFDHRSHEVRYGPEHGYRFLERRGRAAEFPFGFGLSYTSFRYDALELSDTSLRGGQELAVTVRVSNVGARAGSEVVQLYLTYEDGPRAGEPKRLVGFGRLHLAPGEQRGSIMRLTTRELAGYDEASGRFRVEPGLRRLHAGPNSRDLPLTASFRVV